MRLRIMGGASTAGDRNDVWFTTNGANWTPVGVAYAHATFRNARRSDNRCVLNVPGETRICEVTVDATGSGKQVLEIQSRATLTTSISTTIDLGGEILLTGGGLSGAAIANTGNSLLGHGMVAADIDNGGLIAGSAGRLLDLAGQAFANENSGTLTVTGSLSGLGVIIGGFGG